MYRINRHGNFKSGLKALSLVELLLVIAIISLLFSLLLPSLKRVKETAKSVGCVSNLQQLSIAIRSYTSDFQGRFLPGTMWVENDTDNIHWYMPLCSYMNTKPPDLNNATNPKSLWSDGLNWRLCPSKSLITQQPAKNWDMGYGFNRAGFGSQWLPAGGTMIFTDTIFATRVGDVKKPGKLIVIGDSKDRDPLIDGDTWMDYQLPNKIGLLAYFPRRHRDGGNYLYVDGHVEWHSYSWITTSVNFNERMKN